MHGFVVAWHCAFIAHALPVTVAQAELSFSVLKRMNNYLWSTMHVPNAMTSLGTLAVESELAKHAG